MRTVKIEGKSPPADWVTEADAVTKLLLAASSADERKQILEDNEKLWRDARILGWLRDLFHNKCWYSEASDCVSHDTVDHFRPKGRIKQGPKAPEEDGYWWLAFDWKNYRMCGSLLNSKKNDLFPICQGPRAVAGDARSLELEEYTLIDPISDDAGLISFEEDEDGCLVVHAPSCTPDQVQRVESTVRFLGLNTRDKLNKKRRDTWDAASSHIADFESASSSSAARALAALLQREAKKRLREMIRYEAEFSSVAFACVEKQAPETLRKLVFAP